MNGNAESFQKMLLKLRVSFIEEMPEKLQSMENLIFSLEKQPDDRDTFDAFYRMVHSLKGSGGSFGLHIVTTICHQLEDLLNSLNEGSPFNADLVALSLKYIDLLRLAVSTLKVDDANFLSIEQELQALRKQAATKKFTVLVVDNSKLYSNIYLTVLQQLPVQAVLMNDGIQALSRALLEPFDLILTANEVPMLNGLAFVGALKLSDSTNRHTKTILITSNKKIGDSHNRNTDPDYFILKDVKLPQNLHAAVKHALSLQLSNSPAK